MDGIAREMDGIAREMELAALPGGASGHGAPGCTQSRVIIRTMNSTPRRPRATGLSRKPRQ